MIINNLFHKLRNVLQKRMGPKSAIIPFALGRVYQCYYRNWHHDPRPLIFILGSDAFHTVGVNIHYLGAYQHALMHFIMLMRESKTIMTGWILYKMLKLRQPSIPKIAFRKYFTSMLRGKLVSEGISTLPEPNRTKFLVEPWVRRLNRLIHPPIFSFNKTQFLPNETEEVRNQAIQTQYSYDKNIGRPFSDRKMNQPNQPTLPNQPTPPGGNI